MLPIEQMRAELMNKNRYTGLSQLTSIGANEAPNMNVKQYVPMPSGGNPSNGGLPIGGVDMSIEQQGQQLVAPPQAAAPDGMNQVPNGDRMPSVDGTGMPPAPNMNPGQVGPQGPATQQTPSSSNILQMTPQGQAMSAMSGGQPPQKLAKGGSATGIGYLESTPKKPNPLVGTRFSSVPQGNLNQRQQFDIMAQEGKGSILPIPYDATSRDNLVTSVSGKQLTEPLLTEGGNDYSLDKRHMAQNIGGASNLGIADRVQKRTNQASAEHGGDVFMMPNTMGDEAENFSHHPAHIVLDLLKQRQLNKETMKKLTDDLRSQPETNPKTKVKTFPYQNFLGYDHPNMMDQVMKGGYKLGTTAGNLRKKMMQRLGLVNIQKMLDYNIGDVKGSILDPDLATDPKGYMGHTVVKAQAGAPIGLGDHRSYDSNYAGTNVGGMGNRPLELTMPDVYENTAAELLKRPSKTVKTPAQQRAQVIGALEKRKEKFAQPINARVINNAGLYAEGLKQGEFDPKNVDSVLAYFKRQGGYAKGGKVKLHDDSDTMQLELSRKSKKAK